VSADDRIPNRPNSGFAERMTQLMHDGGHSFRHLAAAVNADAGYLNHLAKGRRLPSDTMAKVLDTALAAGGALVDLARSTAEGHLIGPVAPVPLGEFDATSIRGTLQHLVALDTAYGSAGLSSVAVRAFRDSADRLSTNGGTADVRSAVADLGAAAAWITSDDVQRDLSRSIALEALSIADLAGDMRMRRFLLSHLSMVAEHSGRFADALAYADRALDENVISPRVKAMFEVRRARALSGLGGAKAAITAWDKAEHLLTASPTDDDGLTYWIHDAEMAIHRAVILTRGNDQDAVEWAQRGVEWLPEGQGRDQVLFRAMLLHDAVVARAWPDVPRIAEDLLQHAGASRSARVPETLETALRLLTGQRVPAGARDAVRAARDAFI
jgi:hypothetical protein